jgi:hypothetical protein
MAYLIVSGEPVGAAAGVDPTEFNESAYPFDDMWLPEVDQYLQPIPEDELRILYPDEVDPEWPVHQVKALSEEVDLYNETVGAETVQEIGGETIVTVQKPEPVEPGMYRTRTVTYSGWGAGDFPLVALSEEDIATVEAHHQGRDLQKLRYYQAPDSLDMPGGLTLTGIRSVDEKGNDLGTPPPVLLPPNIRTMAIDGRKFNPTDPIHPKMLWWSAEEWMLTNNSVTLWGDKAQAWQFITDQTPATEAESQALIAKAEADGNAELANTYKLLQSHEKPPTYWGHQDAYPISRAEAQERGLAIITKGADHPFHIHQNPFWVLRIEVPDAAGNLVNILDQPRWQDTVWIPRNGGRVIFRARFPDYLGVYVDHCHILLHEDNGMMQAVETVPTANSANYVPRYAVASHDMSPEEVDELYPTASKDLGKAWVDSMTFIDSDPNTGQVFPGFPVTPPEIG